MKQQRVTRYWWCWCDDEDYKILNEEAVLKDLIVESQHGHPIRSHIVGPLTKKLDRMLANGRLCEEGLYSKDRKRIHTQFKRAYEALGLIPPELKVYHAKKGDVWDDLWDE